jgi:hypothetical protein
LPGLSVRNRKHSRLLRCVTAAPPLPGLSQHDIRTYHGFRAPKPG